MGETGKWVFGGRAASGDGLWQKLNQLEPSVWNRRPLVYVCHPITSGYGLFTFLENNISPFWQTKNYKTWTIHVFVVPEINLFLVVWVSDTASWLVGDVTAKQLQTYHVTFFRSISIWSVFIPQSPVEWYFSQYMKIPGDLEICRKWLVQWSIHHILNLSGLKYLPYPQIYTESGQYTGLQVDMES